MFRKWWLKSMSCWLCCGFDSVNYNQSQEDQTITLFKKKRKTKDVLKIFYIKPSLKLDQSCISLGLLLEPFFDLDMKRDPPKKKTHNKYSNSQVQNGKCLRLLWVLSLTDVDMNKHIFLSHPKKCQRFISVKSSGNSPLEPLDWTFSPEYRLLLALLPSHHIPG